jgi:hypothetical protein
MLQACTHRQASKPITVMRNVSIRLKASRTQKIGTDGVGHLSLRRASPLLADRVACRCPLLAESSQWRSQAVESKPVKKQENSK